MSWLSSPLIIRLFPYVDYHESVILQNTNLKGLILIIKSTYQGWYHSLKNNKQKFPVHHSSSVTIFPLDRLSLFWCNKIIKFSETYKWERKEGLPSLVSLVCMITVKYLMCLMNYRRNQFRFLHTDYLVNLKGSVGLILAKVSDMRISEDFYTTWPVISGLLYHYLVSFVLGVPHHL